MNPHASQLRRDALKLLEPIPEIEVRIGVWCEEVTDKLERIRELKDERDWRIREAGELRRDANQIEAEERASNRRSA